MTAPTTTRSAYPAPIDHLIPQAQDLADRLGEVPSRNRLMKEFRLGSPKATALREALTVDLTPPPAPAAPPATEPIPNADGGPVTDPVPAADTTQPAPPTDRVAAEPSPLLSPAGHPGTIDDQQDPALVRTASGRAVAWPVLLLALPAFVAIWAGWVELGKLTGFGKVNLLPGIGDGWVIDTAITLPIGVETYAAFALWAWLSGRAGSTARRFAKWSALASLAVGALGQITYHLMAAAGWTSAPWLITAAVACLPVAVLGMGAALAHLLHTDR